MADFAGGIATEQEVNCAKAGPELPKKFCFPLFPTFSRFTTLINGFFVNFLLAASIQHTGIDRIQGRTGRPRRPG